MLAANIQPERCSTSINSWRWLLMLLALAVAMPAAGQENTGVPAPASDSAGEDELPAEPPRHAFELGNFRIKNFRPVEREKVRLDFTVWVEVEDGKQTNFQQVWNTRKHRIRNQIITSARLVPPNEFEDPTLHALRRRIFLRLRRAVPELPVSEVFISEFSYIVE